MNPCQKWFLLFFIDIKISHRWKRRRERIWIIIRLKSDHFDIILDAFSRNIFHVFAHHTLALTQLIILWSSDSSLGSSLLEESPGHGHATSVALVAESFAINLHFWVLNKIDFCILSDLNFYFNIFNNWCNPKENEIRNHLLLNHFELSFSRERQFNYLVKSSVFTKPN